ncbi:hypothetical protein F4X33_20350 [Candidatus Poribacteria bacterium]|nr:hypothetical protein [Chloroflexota bacterium]MYE91339.1 hypothetical protein [Candidatus Poribacteria bacterium]
MTAQTPVWAALGAWMLLGAHASWTDLRQAIISRRACWATGTAIAASWAVSAFALGEPGRLARSLAATAAVASLVEITYRIRPSAVGYGDIRLIIVNSLLVSWWGFSCPWWALATGAIAAWPGALMTRLRSGRDATVRCAPALAFGTALVAAFLLVANGPIP